MAAAAPHRALTERGAALLLEHCAALDPRDTARPRAYTRLEETLGDRLARLLLGALVGDHRLSPRDLG